MINSNFSAKKKRISELDQSIFASSTNQIVISSEQLKYKYGQTVKLIGSGISGKVYATNRGYAEKDFSLDADGEIKISDLRELAALRYLHHPNIISLLAVNFTKLTIQAIINLAQESLQDLMYREIITQNRRQLIIYQILNGLAYCHAHQIWHRDIKPANILYCFDGSIKLADFGLAKSYAINGVTHTDSMVTPWYRPPEIFFGLAQYNQTIDVWSVGIILLEMMVADYRKEPTNLFANAYYSTGIIRRLIKYIGGPLFWPQIKQLPNYHSFVRLLHGQPQALWINRLIEKFGYAEMNLLQAMLTWNPDHRIKAVSALNLPYFKGPINKLIVPPNNQIEILISQQIKPSKTNFSQQARFNFLHWIYDIIIDDQLNIAGFFLTQQLFDFYLATSAGKTLTIDTIQLVGATIYRLVSLLIDLSPIQIDDLIYWSKDGIDQAELINLVPSILTALDLKLITPTVHNFYVAYTQRADQFITPAMRVLISLVLSYDLVTTYQPNQIAQLCLEYLAKQKNQELPNDLRQQPSLLNQSTQELIEQVLQQSAKLFQKS